MKTYRDAVLRWSKENLAAILLVLGFILIYVFSQATGTAFERWGSTSMEYLRREYYRWLTCIFLHSGFAHIFFNSLALLAVGSLVSPFIGKGKTLFLFILCGILAEIACSMILRFSAPIYGGGSSGGIFALIAAFIVCYLRFPQNFALKWYRPDVLLVAAYFIFASDNLSSFLTHVFGFTAGIVVSFVLVLTGIINAKTQKPNAG